VGDLVTWPPWSASGRARRGQGDWETYCSRAHPQFVLDCSGGLWPGLGAVGWTISTSLTLVECFRDLGPYAPARDQIAPVVISFAPSSRRASEGVSLRAAVRVGYSRLALVAMRSPYPRWHVVDHQQVGESCPQQCWRLYFWSWRHYEWPTAFSRPFFFRKGFLGRFRLLGGEILSVGTQISMKTLICGGKFTDMIDRTVSIAPRGWGDLNYRKSIKISTQKPSKDGRFLRENPSWEKPLEERMNSLLSRSYSEFYRALLWLQSSRSHPFSRSRRVYLYCIVGLEVDGTMTRLA